MFRIEKQLRMVLTGLAALGAFLLLGAFVFLQQAEFGADDLWIACHALADDCTLVTNNTGEFERVQGITLDNWAG